MTSDGPVAPSARGRLALEADRERAEERRRAEQAKAEAKEKLEVRNMGQGGCFSGGRCGGNRRLCRRYGPGGLLQRRSLRR